MALSATTDMLVIKQLLSNISDIPKAKEQLAMAGLAPSTPLTCITINDHGPSFVMKTQADKDAQRDYPQPSTILATIREVPPHDDKTVYLLDVFMDTFPIPQNLSKILSDTFSHRKCYTALHFRELHRHSSSCSSPCFINTSVCHLGRVIDECAALHHEAILIDTVHQPASLTYRKKLPENIFISGGANTDIDLKFENLDSLKNLENENISQCKTLNLSVWNAINASAYKKQITTKARHNGYLNARTDDGTRAVTYAVENMKIPETTTALKFTDCCLVKYFSSEPCEEGRSLTLTMVPSDELEDDESFPPRLEYIDGKGITKLSLHSYVHIPKFHQVSFPDLKELSFEITSLKDVDFITLFDDVYNGIFPLIAQVEKLHIGLNFEMTPELVEKLKSLGDIKAPMLKHLSMDIGMNDPGDLFTFNSWKCPNIETLHVNTEIGYNYCLRLLEDFDNARSIKITTMDGSKQVMEKFPRFQDRALADYVVFENLEELEIFTGMDTMLLAHPERVVLPKLKKLKVFGEYIYWRRQEVVFNKTSKVYTLNLKEMPLIEDIDLAITLGRQTIARGQLSTGSLRNSPKWNSNGETLQVIIFSSAPGLKRLHITGDPCCLTLQGKSFLSLETIDLTQDRDSPALKAQLQKSPQALTMDCPIAYNFSSRYQIPSIKTLKYKTIRWPAVAHTGKSSRVWTPETDIQAEKYVRDLWDDWKELYGQDEPEAKRAKTLEVDETEYRGSGWLQIKD